MAEKSISESRYQAHRLRIPVSAPIDDFRRRYEQAVPAVDFGAVNALVAADGHDQAVMMYAPLRPMIASRDGETHFIVELPSATFSSFGAVGADDIAEVGIELDHKLAALLDHLDAPVPPTLRG
jgi:hypothetical protein